MNLPYIPDEFFEIMHEFSVFLLKDDKHDLGYYRYYKRKGHYYMGRPAPNHPGMLHHWQVGMAGLIVAQLGGLLNLARNALTTDDMAQNMDESQLYDESTVIDLPESAVQTVPDPSSFPQEVETQQEFEEYIQSPPEIKTIEKQEIIQLSPIPSLSPIIKLPQ